MAIALYISGGILFLIPFIIFLIKKIKEGKKRKFYEIFEDTCVSIILFLWDIITLPIQLIKAIFYAHDGERRFRFSLTRTLFALAAFFMLFRMFIGGKNIDVVNIGPEVVVEKKQTRGWVSAKKIQAKQVNLHELLLFLIFAGLYYFRRDLNKGDRKGFLERLVVLLGEAYAMKIAGQHKDPSTPTTPPLEVEKKIEQELSQKPPEAPKEK